MKSLLVALFLSFAQAASPSVNASDSGDNYLEALIYTLLSLPDLALKLVGIHNEPKNKEIYGHCYLSVDEKPTPTVCRDTYVLVTDLKTNHKKRVWISTSDGSFSLPFVSANRFELKAIDGQASSRPLVVSEASEITLHIDSKSRRTSP